MSNEARDQQAAASVFRQTVDLFENESIDYAVGGGLATDHWTGGVKRISDIDVVIREEDGPRILSLFDSQDYRTEEMERGWLHKGFKDGVTVDLMYELKNGTRIDDPFLAHRTKADILGTRADIMAAEDQIASLAGTVDRQTIGQHWYNMLDIMSNNDLEWDYVLTRCHRIPLQMLSVVYYALSSNIPIPKGVIDQLVEMTDVPER